MKKFTKKDEDIICGKNLVVNPKTNWFAMGHSVQHCGANN